MPPVTAPGQFKCDLTGAGRRLHQSDPHCRQTLTERLEGCLHGLLYRERIKESFSFPLCILLAVLLHSKFLGALWDRSLFQAFLSRTSSAVYRPTSFSALSGRRSSPRP